MCFQELLKFNGDVCPEVAQVFAATTQVTAPVTLLCRVSVGTDVTTNTSRLSLYSWVCFHRHPEASLAQLTAMAVSLCLFVVQTEKRNLKEETGSYSQPPASHPWVLWETWDRSCYIKLGSETFMRIPHLSALCSVLLSAQICVETQEVRKYSSLHLLTGNQQTWMTFPLPLCFYHNSHFGFGNSKDDNIYLFVLIYFHQRKQVIDSNTDKNNAI